MSTELNLFEMLEGQRSENLTTQLLAFILRHPRYRNIQQLFYGKLLKDGQLEGTAERELEVTTQVSDEQGRPDLKISGGKRGAEICILVENKLTAEYTDKQLYRYGVALQKEHAVRRILVLLCPRIWMDAYVRNALTHFSPTVSTLDELKNLLRNDGIEFQVLDWDHLLRLIGTESMLLAEFGGFIGSRYLRSLSFSTSDMELLMNSEIPVLIEKTLLLVDRMRDALNALEIPTPKKLSSSINYYGFFFEFKGWEYWLGYYLQQWKRAKTPIVLQVIRAPNGVSLKESAGHLSRFGFYENFDLAKKESWYWPVRFAADDESSAQQAASAVKSTVVSVANAFLSEQHLAQDCNDVVVAGRADILRAGT